MATSTDDRPRVLPVLALGLVLGLAWGAATSGLQTVLPWPFEGLANAISPWVVPSFVVGALSRSWRTALVAGVLACAGQVLGYYGVSALRGFGVFPPTVVRWLLAAAPGGLVFAAAGHLWHRCASTARSGLGAALLAGVFLTEGLVSYGWYLRYTGDAVVFTTIGVLLLVLLAVARPAPEDATPGGAPSGSGGGSGGGARGRGGLVRLCATALWVVPVLLLGAAGQVAVHRVFSQPVDVTSTGATGGADLPAGAGPSTA